MKGQLNKDCFIPREFVVEKIEESFLRIRKLEICLIIYLILSLIVLFSPFTLFIEVDLLPFPPVAWFVFLIFSAVPVAFLIFMALRFTDVDWVLSKHDCGDISDFEAYPRSLRNLTVFCIIFWLFLPILGIILGFILRKRMKDMRNMWMARFNPEPTLEVTETQE